MGLFEEQPLLLVPVILAVVVAYDGVKWLVRRVVLGRPTWRTGGEGSASGS